MQAVVHRRCRDTEKVGDVLVRALVDIEQCCWLPQAHREFRNGGKDGSRVARVEPASSSGEMRSHGTFSADASGTISNCLFRSARNA